MRRGYLGVAAQTAPLPLRLARQLGLEQESAAFVTSVDAGGPAARAGLRDGDLVLEFGGHTISGVDDLHRVLSDETPGRSLEMRVLRRTQLERLTVTPGLPSAARARGK